MAGAGPGTYGSSGLARGTGRGGRVDSRLVSFWCWSSHTTTVRLAADVPVPDEWPCGQCGEAAGPDQGHPPRPAQPRPANGGRTPLEYLLMRRTPEEGEQILAEALDRVRRRRESGHR
jgi:RNA polymerase-binding protein